MKYFHLTTPQHNIWNLQKYYEKTAIGNLCGAIFYKEKRNDKLLKKAIRMFINSQSGLRLRFVDEHEPKQYVSEKIDESIPVITFASTEKLDSYAEQFAKEPIGLANRTMYRFVIFEIGNQSGILVVLSHLISDAWTFGLMANQVDAAYHALADKSECKIVQEDYTFYIQAEAEYLSSERFLKDKCFWEEKYTAIPEKTSVKFCPFTSTDITAKRITRLLPMSLERKLENYCSHNSVTQAVLFETTLAIYLSKINQENNSVTIGVPVLNRNSAKEKRIAGMFVSTMPLTVSINEETTISDLSKQITKEHINVFRHQKYPYSAILKFLREKSNFEGNLYDVMISYQNAHTDTIADTKWYSNGYSEVPLAIHIDNRDGHERHTINVDYQTEIFHQETEVHYIIDRLEYILKQVVEDNGRCIKDISIVPKKEWNTLINEFNDTYIEYPREKCVHELFSEQAAKTPDRTALVFEDRKFTYKELDEMSNSLAHFLRAKGVKPNDVVPIIAKRSWHIIVGMLGILKSGAAYMPVSPEFPAERMKYMLETAGARMVLTYGCELKEDVSVKAEKKQIKLEDVDYDSDISNVNSINNSEDLCYVIFTSGSTGRPKGVSVTHRNISNYCHNNNNVCHRVISDANRKIVSVTNIVFDIFVTESLLPLLNGLTIYLADDEEVVSQKKLAKLITVNGIDVLQTTPSKMRSYILNKDDMEYLSVLKTIILGGEALPADLYKTIEKHTKARIFNIYGPAETTVWSTNKEITDERWLAHEQFERMAAMYPDRTAIVASDGSYTYRELDEKSNALAQKLISMGIKEGKVVGAYLERTARVVISQLAVLKSGGAFLPIDRRYPKERIDYMFEDCKVEIVITDEDLGSDWNVRYINLGSYCFEDVMENQIKSAPEAVCYVIYTSGSTGKPKGCMLKHKGVANFCANCNIVSYAEKLEHQTVVSVNTISFDFFIAESLVPLAHGWTMVFASEEESNNKEKFIKLVTENDVNIVETTPTRLEIYTKDEKKDSYFRRIQLVVSAGEALSEKLLKRMRDISSAKIYNPLGPSECSIWNVDGDFKNDITIGKPIANTQIYILDRNQKLLPIGVAGELCIAGDGVGGGYLNRPDLTAEKFIRNPFATEENHHGKIMYRTGDLARWREDGEIEYLGRIDTQVKIRGLRIELGEIESVMTSYEGIQLVAVTDKKDETGRQYLAGYYTSEGDIDEKELRKFLESKLPKYMVPNYFMRLDTMPMTASGKTDRKNLPVPDMSRKVDAYMPPETEIQSQLCEILRKILNMEKVGIDDDFFEYGGDSLRVIEYVAIAHDKGIDFPMQLVFDNPTVRQLCEAINSKTKSKVIYDAADFKKYQHLFDANQIDSDFVPIVRDMGRVLLTGVTGFLGIHVLYELIKAGTKTVYCLVRAKTDEEAEKRLTDILNYYFDEKYQGEIGKIIIPVRGDIEKEGLTDKSLSEIDTIIHAAASVKHYGAYSYFERVNVNGTGNVVDFARRHNARMIHISTLSVSGNSMADEFEMYYSQEEKHFDEKTFYMGQPLDNVYIHSKFEAERVVYDAILEGMDAKVVRVGNLTNRARDYMFQPNYKSNAFLTRVKAILEFGLFPDYLIPLYAEFSPIDYTAMGVVLIAQYASKKQTVFHLNSNRPMYFDRMMELVKKMNINMNIVDSDTFNNALRKTIKDISMKYIFEAFQNDMDESGKLVYDTNIHIDNEFTVWFLKKLGFEWPEIDEEYLTGYVEYFKKLSYLEV